MMIFHENTDFDEIHQKYLVNHCLEQHFEHFAKTCDLYDFCIFLRKNHKNHKLYVKNKKYEKIHKFFILLSNYATLTGAPK